MNAPRRSHEVDHRLSEGSACMIWRALQVNPRFDMQGMRESRIEQSIRSEGQSRLWELSSYLDYHLSICNSAGFMRLRL